MPMSSLKEDTSNGETQRRFWLRRGAPHGNSPNGNELRGVLSRNSQEYPLGQERQARECRCREITDMNVIERWKALVGECSEAVSNVVEKGAVRKFAEAIGDPNPLYVDEEAAKASRYGRLLAPPTFPRTFEYGEVEGMGPPGQGFIHGEHRIRYERPLFVGEEVLCYAEVKDYYEKEGHEGTLGFLISERVGESLDGGRIFTMLNIAILTPPMRESFEP